MADRLSTARERLAERLLADFKKEITGATNEPVVGDNPENRFFVGKLLTKDNNADTRYGSEVFIESVGADFYIEQSEIQTAEVTVFPRGEFYYRCYPTLEQQRAALLAEANTLASEPFATFEELLAASATVPEKFQKLTIQLIPVYRKISIASPNLSVTFQPAVLLDESGTFGSIDKRNRENSLLMNQIDAKKEGINADKNRYTYTVHEKTAVQDLLSEETYRAFLERNAKRDVSVHQNWSIYISHQFPSF